jgi:hypothetical protein
MSARPKFRLPLLLPILVVLAVVLVKPGLRLYDGLRLARFSHRIANSDRIVGTYALSQVSVTLTRENVRKAVGSVSSASSARPPFGMDWACSYMAKATFFRGTNALGDIRMCSGLFLLGSSQPPFRDESGSLKTLVYTPILVALRESEMKRFDTQ